MATFGENIHSFFENTSPYDFKSPTCGLMEKNIIRALTHLPDNPDLGRFYIASLTWNPEKDHTEGIVASAPKLDLTHIIVFEKNPYDEGKEPYRIRFDEVGTTNIVVLIMGEDGIEYPFAATWQGEITRPLRRGQEIVQLFHQRFEEAQQEQGETPFPDLPN